MVERLTYRQAISFHLGAGALLTRLGAQESLQAAGRAVARRCTSGQEGHTLMAGKNLLSVGLELASDDVEDCGFESDISLLDWDIVLFRPDIGQYVLYGAEQYLGQPSLSESSSFHLKTQCDHWRRQIKDAVASGKTVIVFLCDLQQVYVDSGQREYSGTGRNQRTTRIVSLYSNYLAIPAELHPTSVRGSGIKLGPRKMDAISAYWQEFGGVSEYRVTLGNQELRRADADACSSRRGNLLRMPSSTASR